MQGHAAAAVECAKGTVLKACWEAVLCLLSAPAPQLLWQQQGGSCSPPRSGAGHPRDHLLPNFHSRQNQILHLPGAAHLLGAQVYRRKFWKEDTILVCAQSPPMHYIMLGNFLLQMTYGLNLQCFSFFFFLIVVLCSLIGWEFSSVT